MPPNTMIGMGEVRDENVAALAPGRAANPNAMVLGAPRPDAGLLEQSIASQATPGLGGGGVPQAQPGAQATTQAATSPKDRLHARIKQQVPDVTPDELDWATRVHEGYQHIQALDRLNRQQRGALATYWTSLARKEAARRALEKEKNFWRTATKGHEGVYETTDAQGKKVPTEHGMPILERMGRAEEAYKLAGQELDSLHEKLVNMDIPPTELNNPMAVRMLIEKARSKQAKATGQIPGQPAAGLSPEDQFFDDLLDED